MTPSSGTAPAVSAPCERARSFFLKDLRRVTSAERGQPQDRGERAEHAVGADGGLAPGRVVVERDKHPGPGQVAAAGEQCGLAVGQRGPAGSQPRQAPGARDGDRDRVERALDEHGHGAGQQRVARLMEAEQQARPSCTGWSRGC